jgi:hypothetical protein
MSEEERKKQEVEEKLSGSISRREFLRDAGLVAGGAALGSVALLASCSKLSNEIYTATNTVTKTVTSTGTAAGAAAIKYALFDPSGAINVTQLFSPRLTTLDGKTIAFISNNNWNFAATFDRLSLLLKQKYPTITIINYDKFPTASVDATTWPALQAAVKAAKPDAVIIGNGG